MPSFKIMKGLKQLLFTEMAKNLLLKEQQYDLNYSQPRIEN